MREFFRTGKIDAEDRKCGGENGPGVPRLAGCAGRGVVPAARAKRERGYDLPASRISRTFRSRSFGRNGFWRKRKPGRPPPLSMPFPSV